MRKYKYKYTGTLETYYETGFESLAVIVHDDRGISKFPGFNKETQEWDGPLREFKSLDWAIFLGDGTYYLKVLKGLKIVWEGSITQSLEKMIEFKFRYSFIPKEVEAATWLKWCEKEVSVELSTNKAVLAKESKNKKDNI